MVFVIQDIHQICVEGMDVLKEKKYKTGGQKPSAGAK